MVLPLRLISVLSITILGSQILAAQPSWPRFRGPNGTGIADSDHELPVTFGETRNSIWQTNISEGHSSPIIWADRIFLTGKNSDDLVTLCLNRQTGEILWRKAAPKVKAERVHRVNSPAALLRLRTGNVFMSILDHTDCCAMILMAMKSGNDR